MGVRKNVATLSPGELTDLRDGFAAAYQLSDDRGYAFYAGLHGLPLPSYCQHGTSLFLPWHRAYLYFFENALTDALRGARDDQTASVSLPWWDWASAAAHADGLPAGYLADGNGADNPLAAGPVTLSNSDLQLVRENLPGLSPMGPTRLPSEIPARPTSCPASRPSTGRCDLPRSRASPWFLRASTTEFTAGSAGPCRRCRSPPTTRSSGHTTP